MRCDSAHPAEHAASVPPAGIVKVAVIADGSGVPKPLAGMLAGIGLAPILAPGLPWPLCLFIGAIAAVGRQGVEP